MTGHGTKFGRHKEEAIIALLAHRSYEEAARAIGVTPKTLMRWLKDPEFTAEYRAAQRATFSQATARLKQMVGAAVTTLGKVMVDPNTPASTKVRTAHSVIELAAKAIEVEDHEARISELERAAQASKGHKK